MRKIPLLVVLLTAMLVMLAEWAGQQVQAAPAEVTFTVSSTVDDIDDSVRQDGLRSAVVRDGDGGDRCDIGAFEYQPPQYLPLIRR